RAAGPPRALTETRQIGFVVGSNYVISVHDDADDVLDPVRQRLQNPQGRLRRRGVDYLAYAMIDAAADTFFPLLEQIGDKIEELERHALQTPSQSLLESIQLGKNRLMQLRRVVWAQRELLYALLLDDSPFFDDDARAHLRSTHEHCVQISDVVDVYREAASGLITTYMSAVAHRSNEVMKVLTMMSSVFVPLTFIAGVYGMNFKHMPELGMRWSYPLVWTLMAATAGGMLFFFRRCGWLGNSRLYAAGDDGLVGDQAAETLDHRILILRDHHSNDQRGQPTSDDRHDAAA
ncbi:MAG: magnesium/cobalt transporter CorA, partial [Planctomycetota bacterium]